MSLREAALTIQDRLIPQARSGSATATWTVWAIEIMIYRLDNGYILMGLS